MSFRIEYEVQSTLLTGITIVATTGQNFNEITTEVYLDGVYQDLGDNYTIANNTITMIGVFSVGEVITIQDDVTFVIGDATIVVEEVSSNVIVSTETTNITVSDTSSVLVVSTQNLIT